jgi:flagellar secretion chaperone FliS
LNTPLDAYRQVQIKTANQGRLILMLYDGAIRSIDMALDALPEKQRRYELVNTSIIKAQDIVGELMASLDFERGGDLARNLFALYVYMNRQLLEANLRKIDKPLADVRRMLADLRSAWAAVAAKSPAKDGAPSRVDIAG